MKVNVVVFISKLSLLLFIGSCGADMKKFDWEASESGPKGYPTRIVSGDFTDSDGGSLYVPPKNILNGPWGSGQSSHAVGADLKHLPNQLDITYLSLTENQFYHGQFDLPYEKILKLFQEGYYSQNAGGHLTYRRITVGVLPGGGVAIWLAGIDSNLEVFFGQAEKVDIDWKRVTNSDMPRVEYVQIGVDAVLSSEEKDEIKKEGIPFDKWSNYRVRYRWKPYFFGMKITDDLIIQAKYFNGENGSLFSPENDKIKTDMLAVPKFMSFIWERGERGAGHDLSLNVFFDEAEIFDAFKKLGTQNQDIKMEYRMEVDEKGKQAMYIWLVNSKDKISLKKVKVESFGVLP